MTADDVRWLAQKVVAKAFHGVSDASVEALARRVLELEADAEEHADDVRAVEREQCAIAGAAAVRHSQQTTDQCRADVAAAIRARGAQASIGRGDPVQWEPVPDDVVLAVCVHYRDELLKAFEQAAGPQDESVTWRDVIDSVKMLGKPVRARGGK